MEPELFIRVVSSDPRIGPTHISLYVVIYFLIRAQNAERIRVQCRELMQAAKIGGIATFNKCIRDLHSFGYVEYKPSFDRYRGSTVSLVNQTVDPR
jgi:hypothetical protein